jgi:hypothetical protein
LHTAASDGLLAQAARLEAADAVEAASVVHRGLPEPGPGGGNYPFNTTTLGSGALSRWQTKQISHLEMAAVAPARLKPAAAAHRKPEGESR